RAGVGERELAQALERDAGLKGLTGTADMREVLALADAGEEPARLGLDVYVHRLRAGIAAMGASLGGIDALAFTGGVGEASPLLRDLATTTLSFLGLALDEASNRASSADAEISATEAVGRTRR